VLTAYVRLVFRRDFTVARAVALIALTLPIVVVSNTVRIIATGMLKHYVGDQAIQGLWHEALGYLVKVPLVYTNVALANWRAFASLGVDRVHCPGSYHSSVRLNPVANIGAYRAPRSPDEPILIQMVRTPCQPGLSERDQHRAEHVDAPADARGLVLGITRHRIGDQAVDDPVAALLAVIVAAVAGAFDQMGADVDGEGAGGEFTGVGADVLIRLTLWLLVSRRTVSPPAFLQKRVLSVPTWPSFFKSAAFITQRWSGNKLSEAEKFGSPHPKPSRSFIHALHHP